MLRLLVFLHGQPQVLLERLHLHGPARGLQPLALRLDVGPLRHKRGMGRFGIALLPQAGIGLLALPGCQRCQFQHGARSHVAQLQFGQPGL
ncbi:hypothetical protein CS8_076600 [Cupriavidus sp. 8B]